jgi:hypothetical protein
LLLEFVGFRQENVKLHFLFMQNFDVFVPLLDEGFVIDGDVNFHLSSLVEEFCLLKFLPYLREGQLNEEVLGDILYFVRYFS